LIKLKNYVNSILSHEVKYHGFSFITGNSIPYYITFENYIAMINAVREYRNKTYYKRI